MNDQPKLAAEYPQSIDDLRRLTTRAQQGDPAALSCVRQIAQAPLMIEMFGDLPRRVECASLDAIAGDNVIVKEALRAKIMQMRAELAGPEPLAMEKLLIDRIVILWLQLYHVELRQIQMDRSLMALGDQQQRQVERLERRYVSAIKALATVRRLAVPVLVGQMNLIKKQVNVTKNAAPVQTANGSSSLEKPIDATARNAKM